MARGLALIVDDSSTARIILSRVLAKIDVPSKGVATAEAALETLAQDQERPDVIFLDHLLPGMDGFQALRELKRQPHTRDIPVFMYTSQGADQYIEEARALGAAGVIGKQMDREQLYRRLSGILARQFTDVEDAVETSRRPVPAAADARELEQRQMRRLTGRLSTLEIAYEEANEELRSLRHEMASLRVEHSNLYRINRRNSRIGAALGAVLLAIGLIQFAQFDTVHEALAEVQAQFRDVEAVVSALVDLRSAE